MRRTVFLMIVLLWAVIAILSLFVVVRGEKITLQWDPVDGVDGYYIYQTIRAGSPPEHQFNYDQPVTNELYPNGKIPQDVTQITIDLLGVEDADTKYMFTARAFRGDEKSENSNEVSYVVSLIPPFAAVELVGGYDKDAGLINLSWQQPGGEPEYRQPVSHWIVYCRERGAEEWKAIGRINSDHELSIEAPISAIMTGDKATLEFTIVSYRRSGVFSQNSDILSIEVDMRDVPPIQNLRLNIEIPIT